MTDAKYAIATINMGLGQEGKQRIDKLAAMAERANKSMSAFIQAIVDGEYQVVIPAPTLEEAQRARVAREAKRQKHSAKTKQGI